MSNRVADNYGKVQQMIAEACGKSGRNVEDVTVVGVTKYTDAQGVQACIDAGIVNIGENLVQHALPKIEMIGNLHPDVHWHFIGHLQTNKVKYVLPHFAMIHSLDRLSLAKEIQNQAVKLGKYVECLLQVNISGETTKFGVAERELVSLAEAVSQFDHIKVKGLMTMAPHVEDPEQTRDIFARLRMAKEQLSARNLPNFELKHLSMGMSNDFTVAVEEGATLVRLGSVLF